METTQRDTSPLVKEVLLNASPERVWEAITDKEQMKEWYFDIAAFKPEAGFEFQFDGTDGCETFTHICRITEVVEGKKLKHTWTYKDTPGESFVTFELFPEGDKTKLKLTHEGLHTFPADHKSFKRDSFNQGWTQIIQTNIKNYLEK